MKTILVSREPGVFSRILAENNFETLNLPLIETRELKDLSDFDAKLARLVKYDGILLTSAAAAKIFRAKLNEKQIKFSGKVYVLGRRSFEVLKTENLDLVFDETAATAREMMENIAPEDLKNRRLLFVCGAKSLRVVPEFLAEIAAVDEIIVYETREIVVGAGEIKKLREKFARNEIAAACFFSPSQATVFLEQFGAEITHQTLIATIGKTTAEFFERQNLKVGFVSSKSSAETFAVELIEYLREKI